MSASKERVRKQGACQQARSVSARAPFFRGAATTLLPLCIIGACAARVRAPVLVCAGPQHVCQILSTG